MRHTQLAFLPVSIRQEGRGNIEGLTAVWKKKSVVAAKPEAGVKMWVTGVCALLQLCRYYFGEGKRRGEWTIGQLFRALLTAELDRSPCAAAAAAAKEEEGGNVYCIEMKRARKARHSLPVLSPVPIFFFPQKMKEKGNHVPRSRRKSNYTLSRKRSMISYF